VYKYDGPYQAYIDITAVPQLKIIKLEARGVVLGGSMTLAVAIEQLGKAASIDGFEYAEQMSTHIQRVANVPVRNVSVYCIYLKIVTNQSKTFTEWNACGKLDDQT